MLDDIDMVRSFRIQGIVFGATLSKGGLDEDFLEQLISHAFGLKKTLHRAVDTLNQTIDSVEIGIKLGFDTILSSGGQKTALEGLPVLSEMQSRAAGKITIMPGSGINPISARQILNQCPVSYTHLTLPTILLV